MPRVSVTAASRDPTSCISLYKAGWPITPSRAKDGIDQFRLNKFGGPFGFDTD